MRPLFIGVHEDLKKVSIDVQDFWVIIRLKNTFPFINTFFLVFVKYFYIFVTKKKGYKKIPFQSEERKGLETIKLNVCYQTFMIFYIFRLKHCGKYTLKMTNHK